MNKVVVVVLHAVNLAIRFGAYKMRRLNRALFMIKMKMRKDGCAMQVSPLPFPLSLFLSLIEDGHHCMQT